VADRDERTAEHAGRRERLEAALPGTEPVLEDRGEPRRSLPAVGGGKLVELPQADRGRLLDEHAHPGAQAAERQLAVARRRRAHVHEIGSPVAEQVA
jgi:hypothetical protein